MNGWTIILWFVTYFFAKILKLKRWQGCDSILPLPMLAHHFCTGFIGLANTVPSPLTMHYSCFYGGLIEFTNIPLAMMDAMKSQKILTKKYPLFYFWVRFVFAIGFIWLRLIMWTCINFGLFWDWTRYIFHCMHTRNTFGFDLIVFMKGWRRITKLLST